MDSRGHPIKTGLPIGRVYNYRYALFGWLGAVATAVLFAVGPGEVRSLAAWQNDLQFILGDMTFYSIGGVPSFVAGLIIGSRRNSRWAAFFAGVIANVGSMALIIWLFIRAF